MISNAIFKELGFSEKEVSVYLALLKLDTASVTEVANKTEINRTTCYDILSSLAQRGLILKIIKKEKTFFNAMDPKRLLSYIDREKDEYIKKMEQNKKRIEDALPELSSLIERKSTKPKVIFFEGEKGMREAYEDTLSAKNGILAYANVKTMHEGLPNFFPEYYNRRAGAGVHIKAIMPANKESIARSQRDKEEKRESIILKNPEKTFSPEINIYNDKILFASWKEKMAIIIESKELADAQRLIYDELWEKLKQ